MTDFQPNPFSETEKKIIEAAISSFVRFGVRRTSMSDIATFAGVSRQTLYDLFGNKDALIRAAIRHISDQSIAAIKERLSTCASLGVALDIYLEETVLKSFDLLQAAADPEDLISGHNTAGGQEIDRSHARQKQLVEDILRAHMADRIGDAPARLANYAVTVAMSFKYVKDKVELTELLASLKEGILAVAQSK